MDFTLTPAQEALRARAAAFVDEDLIPLEVEAERNGGRLEPADYERIQRRPPEPRLAQGCHPKEHGGEGWSVVEQVLVHEELGRNTNGVWFAMDSGYNVLSMGTPEQVECYLKPVLAGQRADAYAVTEAGAGSDPGA